MKLFTKRSGVTINISTEAIVRTIFLVIAAFFVIVFIGRITHELTLFAISAFLALALNPAVSGLSRRLRIKSRIRATGLAYLVVLVLLTGFIAVVVPPLVRQTNDFIKTIPSTVQNLNDSSSAPGRLIDRYNLQDQVDKVSDDLKDRTGDVPGLVFNTAGRIGGIIISLITVVVLTFMMLVEGPLWFKRILAIMPKEKQADYKDLGGKMYKVVTGYVNGQVLIAAIASFFSFIAIMIASQITNASINAAALAGIVFLFGLIPLIGNTIAAVIVVILSLFVSTPLAIIMAIYFPIYQQIENATLQPHIQAKTNQLTPLLVFMAALIGAGFGGILGAFIAIPVAGCLRILVEHHFGDALVPTEESVKEA
ncbi:MAG: family transporter [Patescibacteria group bacterium]|nr:family transporter [Patescibacteria group bacterium]